MIGTLSSSKTWMREVTGMSPAELVDDDITVIVERLIRSWDPKQRRSAETPEAGMDALQDEEPRGARPNAARQG